MFRVQKSLKLFTPLNYTLKQFKIQKARYRETLGELSFPPLSKTGVPLAVTEINPHL